MPRKPKRPLLAHIRVAGPDRKGIIATMTGYCFRQNLNIVDIDQRILEGYLIMNMQVDVRDLAAPRDRFVRGIRLAGKGVGMAVQVTFPEERAIKRLALLVTKEPHCAEAILKEIVGRRIKAQPVVMIGTYPDLAALAKRYRVPFAHIPFVGAVAHEEAVLRRLDALKIDLVVLARYMQILSPEFVFRYEGRIINIHPSLLPAFAGPRAYEQAFNKGVEVIGATAHFVTTELDRGAIICQEAARVHKARESLADYVRKGLLLEQRALARAVKLFCEDRLVLRRGKVIDSRREHALQEVTRHFYEGMT